MLGDWSSNDSSLRIPNRYPLAVSELLTHRQTDGGRDVLALLFIEKHIITEQAIMQLNNKLRKHPRPTGIAMILISGVQGALV